MMLFCVQRERVRTAARSIDAAIIKEPGYGCDCRLPNGIYRQIRDRSAYRTQIFLSHGRRGERSRIHQHGLDGSIRNQGE